MVEPTIEERESRGMPEAAIKDNEQRAEEQPVAKLEKLKSETKSSEKQEVTIHDEPAVNRQSSQRLVETSKSDSNL